MEKVQGRLPYLPQVTPPTDDAVLFLGIQRVSAPARTKGVRARVPKRPEAQDKTLLSSDRRVTFLDIEVRE